MEFLFIGCSEMSPVQGLNWAPVDSYINNLIKNIMPWMITIKYFFAISW